MDENKIAATVDLIHSIAENYNNPVISTGFGKDAMVMHWIVRQCGYDWPCLFFKDPYFPRKYRFANHVIDAWNLRVYDYPHSSVGIFCNDHAFEVVRHYQMSRQHNIMYCATLEPAPYIEGQTLCAKTDLIDQPMGVWNFPFDIVLNATRTSEIKPHTDFQPCNLVMDLRVVANGPDVAFPIKDWTGLDVCAYTVAQGIPWHKERYSIVDGRFQDDHYSPYNPDHRPACFRCIDPREPKTVYCPKLKCVVGNMSSEIKRVEIPDDC